MNNEIVLYEAVSVETPLAREAELLTTAYINQLNK